METLAQTDLPIYFAKPHRSLAALGVVLGTGALLIAVVGPAILDARNAQPPDLPHVLAESAHKIKDHLAHKDIDVKSGSLMSWSTLFAAGAAMLGFLAAALGTASCARRERWRLSAIAIGVGLTAIAWNYFVAAAIAAVALLLMAWVVSHFHR